jgi:hypothetical protein
VLLVPTDAALERARCGLAETRAWGSIARHIASRFSKQIGAHYADLVGIVRSTTGGYAFVLEGGRELAGGPLPRRLPGRGTIRYRGRDWAVYSWTPAAGVRAYTLTSRGRP